MDHIRSSVKMRTRKQENADGDQLELRCEQTGTCDINDNIQGPKDHSKWKERQKHESHQIQTTKLRKLSTAPETAARKRGAACRLLLTVD